MSSSAGTKVTKDPQALNDPKNENPGVVTSDSLAGESIQGGGSFAANSDARGAMGQPSAGTTTNTTDVSGATTLNPATSHAARSGGASSTKESGVGPTYNTGGSGENAVPSSGNAAPAPGYVNHPAPSMGDTFMPKGKNLTEGGFDSGAPNASFNSDVGGKNDPGREALREMEEKDVPVAGYAGPRQQGLTKDGQFDALDETSA